MRTPYRPLLLFVALGLSFAAAGCFQQEVAVKVDGDGNGTVGLTVLFSEQMLNMVGGVAGATSGEGADPLANASEMAAGYPAEWNARVENVETDDMRGVKVTAEFRGPKSLEEVLARLLTSSSKAMSQQPGSRDAGGAFHNFRVVTSGDDNEIWTITCSMRGSKSDRGPSAPSSDGDGLQNPGDGMPAGAAEAMGKMAEEMMKAKLTLTITMPDITEATCTQTSGADLKVVRRIEGNTAIFEFRPAELGANSDKGAKAYDLRVVGSTKGGLPTSLLVVIGILGLVVIGTLFTVISRR